MGVTDKDVLHVKLKNFDATRVLEIKGSTEYHAKFLPFYMFSSLSVVFTLYTHFSLKVDRVWLINGSADCFFYP